MFGLELAAQIEHELLLAGSEADQRTVALVPAGVPVVVLAESDDAGSPEHRRFAGDLLHECAQGLRVGALLRIRKSRDELVDHDAARPRYMLPLTHHLSILHQ